MRNLNLSLALAALLAFAAAVFAPEPARAAAPAPAPDGAFEFADARSRELFEEYLAFLAARPEALAEESATVELLRASDLRILVRVLPRRLAAHPGNLTTDGERLIVTLAEGGLTSRRASSLNSRFAHELEHARQVQCGELAFARPGGLGWQASPSSYDIGDEARAWRAQARASIASDHWVDASEDTRRLSIAGRFARGRGDGERFDVLRASGYAGVPATPGCNVVFVASKGWKPGELLTPAVVPNFFGRVHSIVPSPADDASIAALPAIESSPAVSSAEDTRADDTPERPRSEPNPRRRRAGSEEAFAYGLGAEAW